MSPLMAVERPAKPLSPPLKWAGGKRWLVPHVLSLWQEHRHRRFVEPLCGAMAMALGLMPQRAILNDINPHLVNFLSWTKQGLYIGIPLENDAKTYYAHRHRFNELVKACQSHSHEAAELFYYLNKTGYNGLCRFNRSGEFNVPFGRYKTIGYIRDLTPYRDVLANWEFISTDFQDVRLDPGDFVYADPPYDVEFRSYSQNGFSWNDQMRLANWLAGHPGPVVLSNQATRRVVDLYRTLGFSLRFLEAPRMISCTGDRTPALEVLATKGV